MREAPAARRQAPQLKNSIIKNCRTGAPTSIDILPAPNNLLDSKPADGLGSTVIWKRHKGKPMASQQTDLAYEVREADRLSRVDI